MNDVASIQDLLSTTYIDDKGALTLAPPPGQGKRGRKNKKKWQKRKEERAKSFMEKPKPSRGRKAVALSNRNINDSRQQTVAEFEGDDNVVELELGKPATGITAWPMGRSLQTVQCHMTSNHRNKICYGNIYRFYHNTF